MQRRQRHQHREAKPSGPSRPSPPAPLLWEQAASRWTQSFGSPAALLGREWSVSLLALLSHPLQPAWDPSSTAELPWRYPRGQHLQRGCMTDLGPNGIPCSHSCQAVSKMHFLFPSTYLVLSPERSAAHSMICSRDEQVFPHHLLLPIVLLQSGLAHSPTVSVAAAHSKAELSSCKGDLELII